ncbi:Mitotic-spindle organizing protein 1B [Camellia lanceoleosa]|uniref:Mitotic-spindle organizing protein 1B n=1 Tax=Camellia lanceoleosa TaxID=1840588 RepID=A0ACC0GG57_9ERIC|nr:Mitotic-spindle organizing protein 1B [Camellia lanceoleosa]
MDPEAARTAQESLDLVFHMSNILDAGLDRHTLSILIALCDLGQNPEALGAVVKELRREPSSSSPMPTKSSQIKKKHEFMSLKLINANMDDEKRRLTFRALNRMGAKSGRITSPSSLLYTIFLLFNGDTNLFANLKDENDLCRIAAVDDEGFKAFFLLKLVWWGREKGKAAVETKF